MFTLLAGLACLQLAVVQPDAIEAVRPQCNRPCQTRYWASTIESQQGGFDYRRRFDYPWRMRPTAWRPASAGAVIAAPQAVLAPGGNGRSERSLHAPPRAAIPTPEPIAK